MFVQTIFKDRIYKLEITITESSIIRSIGHWVIISKFRPGISQSFLSISSGGNQLAQRLRKINVFQEFLQNLTRLPQTLDEALQKSY